MPRYPWPMRPRLSRDAPLIAAAVVGVLGLAGYVATQPGPDDSPGCQVRQVLPAFGKSHQTDLPDRSCTPGAVDETVDRVLACTPGSAAQRRDVDQPQRQRVIRSYGLDPAVFVGEVDHLIPLSLGGSNGDANLWPQAGPIPNEKDTKIERPLLHAVCRGRVSLEEAQRRIATNWPTAMDGIPASQ